MQHDYPVYFLLKGPSLPPANDADAMLGRIVRNFAQPLNDFTPDNAATFNTRPVTTTLSSSVARIIKASNSAALESKFLAFANTNSAKEDSTKESLLSSEIQVKQLQNHGDVFQRLIRDEEIRSRIVEWTHPGGDPVYMIVGVLI